MWHVKYAHGLMLLARYGILGARIFVSGALAGVDETLVDKLPIVLALLRRGRLVVYERALALCHGGLQ